MARSGAVTGETGRVRNETVFRTVNERMKEIDDRLDTVVVGAPAGDREEFFCECDRLDCMARFEMTREQYEAVRAHSVRFVVLSGHEDPEIEQVIETHAQFLVVEKLPGEPAETARETDPRV